MTENPKKKKIVIESSSDTQSSKQSESSSSSKSSSSTSSPFPSSSSSSSSSSKQSENESMNNESCDYNLKPDYDKSNCSDDNLYSNECNKFLLKKEIVERNCLSETPNNTPYLYPNLNDKLFNVKIAEKKEFNDAKIISVF